MHYSDSWPEADRAAAGRLALLAGAAIVIFLFALLLFQVLVFALGGTVTPVSLIPSALFTIALVWLQGGRLFDHPVRGVSLLILTLLCLFLLFLLMTGALHDFSFDGQGYHQAGVLALAGGWNPLRDGPIPYSQAGDLAVFINHYAKGPWICEAILYRLTGHIESAKAFNLLLIAASFFIAFAALSSFACLSRRTVLAGTLLLAANPIALNQSFTFYVDGCLASLLTILISLMALTIRQPKTITTITLVAAITLTVNVKFTGLVFALALSLSFVAYILLFAYRRQILKHTMPALASALFLGVFIAGYHPYITNTLAHANPFYPVTGNSIIDAQMPPQFLAKNRVIKLLTSLFARSDNSGSNEPGLKLPFTLTLREVKGFGSVDVRAAGWGPLTGAATLLSLFILCVALASSQPHTRSFLVACILIVLTALAISEPWWARYVPQLWIVPVLCALFALSAIKGKLLPLAGKALTVVLFFNIALVLYGYLAEQAMNEIKLAGQIRLIRSLPAPVSVSFTSHSRTNAIGLQELAIDFIEKNGITCPHPIVLIGSRTTTICPGGH